MPPSLILDDKVSGAQRSLADSNVNEDHNDPKIDLLPVGPRLKPSAPCPCCSKIVQGIQVLPVSFTLLTRAIQLRVDATSGADAKNKKFRNDSKKRSHKETLFLEELEAEAAYAVYSQGKHSFSDSLGDTESHRTGRWTDEEKEYVNHLVKGFDEGRLPIPHGTKLSSFLSDAILCKASRLTKKMKKARLSIRCYELRPSSLTTATSEPPRVSLSALQEQFISAMPSTFSQLEYQFCLAKRWRSWFSDLCIQIGYPFLDGTRFLASLDEYERRAANAEDGMRSIRRRRMGMNLRVVNTSTTPSAPAAVSTPPVHSKEGVALSKFDHPQSYDEPNFLLLEDINEDQYSGPMTPVERLKMPNEESPQPPASNRGSVVPDEQTATIDELDHSFVDLMAGCQDDGRISTYTFEQDPSVHHPHGPFLEIISSFLTKWNLPFQLADIWVPTFERKQRDQMLHLVHAGYSTRKDLSKQLRSAFDNFGEYSRTFSFVPSKGLVGRVYSTGQQQWEFGVKHLDPDFFLRAGGAEEYGVRSAVGFPMDTRGVGRIVVVLYSCDEVAQDDDAVNALAEELLRSRPEPRWQLVVGIGNPASVCIPDRPLSLGDSAQTAPKFQNNGKSNDDMARKTPPPQVGNEAKRHTVSPRHSEDADNIEGEMISLLGDHLSDRLSGRIGNGHYNEANNVHQLMTLRLRLLRPSHRRSPDENELVEILKRSYRCYSSTLGGSHGQERGIDVAGLLAREWECLTEARASSTNERLIDSVHPNMVGHMKVPNKKQGSSGAHRSQEMDPLMPPLLPTKASLSAWSSKLRQLPHAVPKNSSSFRARRDGAILGYDHSAQSLCDLPSPNPSAEGNESKSAPQDSKKDKGNGMDVAVSVTDEENAS